MALIGPLANTGTNMPGTWSVNSDLENTRSLLEGMRTVLGTKVNVLHSLGCNLLADSAYQERATLFGRTIPRDERPEQELIHEALKTAEKADVIIAALGESSEMSGESSSRTDLGIPAIQRRLLKALLASGKPVVLVLFNGRPLTLTWEDKHVPAILEAWFGGTEAAAAITRILFGEVNPSAKLTATFPQNVGQVPLYYSHKNTGRPLQKDAWFSKFRSNYLDVSNEPLYPFGYGLSYTQYDYSNLVLSTKAMQPGKSLLLTVDLKNTGDVDGEEVVQLYIQDLVGSSTRPVKQLKGFRKVALKAGETKKVSFELTENDLKFYNSELKWLAEPGDFKVFIGGNSRDVLTGEFRLTSVD